MKKQVQKKTQLTLFEKKKKKTVQFTCKQAKRSEADIHPMGRPHVGPMLAFRCADRGLIALRSTSRNVHLDEGKIIMAFASTAALTLTKKKKDGYFDTAIRWKSWGKGRGLCQPRVAGVVVLFYAFPAAQADQLKFRVHHVTKWHLPLSCCDGSHAKLPS